MSADPDVLIRALAQRNRYAANLAMLASAAVQVEPELLRALRLLLPNADAGAEADLWLSDLVESRSTLAMTLRADVRQKLQERLAANRATLDAVAAVLLRVHAEVSDVIRIEEQVTLESLRNEPGAKERIDALLAPIVATLENERHRGLARWAIRAFDAVPTLAKETQSMWRLMRSSSVTRATGTGSGSATVPVEAALSVLPGRNVFFWLSKNALKIQPAIDAPIQPRIVYTSGATIEIPDTVPMMLEIAWDDDGRKSQRVAMQPGDTVHVPLRPRNVTVSAFNGKMWAIEPELELEDYAIVTPDTAPAFREWLVARDGGRLPPENVLEITSDMVYKRPSRARRVYAHLTDMRTFGMLRSGLEDSAGERIFLVEPQTREVPALPEHEVPEHELIIVNDVRQGSVLPPVLEALSGAAADERGTITADDVLRYVRDARPALFWAVTSDDFVLRRNVFTTARFHFPHEMLGARMHLTPPIGEPIVTQIANAVLLHVRPVTYNLAVPKHDYYRTVTFRPGHSDISLGWRFNGKWVIVAGTAYRDLTEEQRLICEAVARSLADHGFGLFVGSFPGVDELAAHVFVERVAFLGGGAVEVFRQYVRGNTTPQFKAARMVEVEDDFEAPLAEASALIVIGGEGGTAEYASRAHEHGVPVFPIAATGGVAAKLAEVSAGEFSIDSVSANDIALHIVEQIERTTAETQFRPA